MKSPCYFCDKAIETGQPFSMLMVLDEGGHPANRPVCWSCFTSDIAEAVIEGLARAARRRPPRGEEDEEDDVGDLVAGIISRLAERVR